MLLLFPSLIPGRRKFEWIVKGDSKWKALNLSSILVSIPWLILNKLNFIDAMGKNLKILYLNLLLLQRACPYLSNPIFSNLFRIDQLLILFYGFWTDSIGANFRNGGRFDFKLIHNVFFMWGKDFFDTSNDFHSIDKNRHKIELETPFIKIHFWPCTSNEYKTILLLRVCLTLHSLFIHLFWSFCFAINGQIN